jgi:hypothetical protein
MPALIFKWGRCSEIIIPNQKLVSGTRPPKCPHYGYWVWHKILKAECACDISFLQNIRTHQAYSTTLLMDALCSYENVGKPLQDYTVLQPGRPHSRGFHGVFQCVLPLWRNLLSPSSGQHVPCNRGFHDWGDILWLSLNHVLFIYTWTYCSTGEQVELVLRNDRGRLQMQVKKQLEIHIRAETEHEYVLKCSEISVTKRYIIQHGQSISVRFVRLSSEKRDHLHVQCRGNTPTREQMEWHILNFKHKINNRST